MRCEHITGRGGLFIGRGRALKSIFVKSDLDLYFQDKQNYIKTYFYSLVLGKSTIKALVNTSQFCKSFKSSSLDFCQSSLSYI